MRDSMTRQSWCGSHLLATTPRRCRRCLLVSRCLGAAATLLFVLGLPFRGPSAACALPRVGPQVPASVFSTGDPVPAIKLVDALEAGVPADAAEDISILAAMVGAEDSEPMSDPLTLLRFYNARSRDVDAAADMYFKTMAWRAIFSIQAVMDAYGSAGEFREDGGRATDPATWNWCRRPTKPEAELALRHAFFGRLSVAPDGVPILVWRAGIADYSGFVREDLVNELINAWVAHVEDALQAARAASLQSKRLVRARLVIDVQGFKLANLRHLPILRQLISLGKNYFPEISASVTVVRAPSFVAKVYSIVGPWLPQLLRDKIRILGEDFEDGLVEHTGLEMSMLPSFLGGQVCDSEVGSAEPVPIGAGAALRR